MLTYIDAVLEQVCVHRVGNKSADGALTLSKQPLALDEDDVLKTTLMHFWLSPFEKINEIYRFSHSTGNIQMNELFQFASQVFNDASSLYPVSRQLAQYLYELGDHPRIKAGELYVALFSNVQIEGETMQALGIFKSEHKEPFLTVEQQEQDFVLHCVPEAINIKKLDKGCMIFNTEKEDGYKVAVVDNTNRNEALYWTDSFLQLKIRNDNYQQTNTVLQMYKTFVTEKMDEGFEITKTDKIDLLNRSIRYFKEKDHFDMDEFSNEVIGNDKGAAMFMDYRKQYEQDFDMPVNDSFEIHNMAVKKQARVYKSVLKLDRNFHIYIHGNRELIEKGFDEERNLSYYKVYFREEQ